MSGYARTERHDMVRTFLEIGPDAPTLCTGWDTRHLAAHLVARESRPDAAPGIMLRPLRWRTEQVQQSLARLPWEELVDRFRNPPFWALLAWGPVEEVVNLTEHFVHHEDVLRAREGWRPRHLSGDYQDALWRAVCSRGRVLYRLSPVGVVVRRPDGDTTRVRDGELTVTLTAEPAEMVLHAFGRGTHAEVEIAGSDDAVAAFQTTRLRV